MWCVRLGTTVAAPGPQVDSKYSTEPGWKQGTSKRFNNRDGRVVSARGTGAGARGASQPAHMPPCSLCSRHAPAAQHVLPHAPAPLLLQDQPGVGAYTVVNNAYGKQILSNKKTLPTPRMGTGTRDAFKRVRLPACGLAWRCCMRRPWWQLPLMHLLLLHVLLPFTVTHACLLPHNNNHRPLAHRSSSPRSTRRARLASGALGPSRPRQ